MSMLKQQYPPLIKIPQTVIKINMFPAKIGRRWRWSDRRERVLWGYLADKNPPPP
jgi:hypothetical protein